MTAERIKALTGDKILIEWEEAIETMAGGKLIRPENFRAAHYTGIVKLVGPLVSEEIRVGDRIMFDQFSNPHEFFDPDTEKRMAIIEESRQGSAFAIIPPRVKIGGGEPGFNYSA